MAAEERKDLRKQLKRMFPRLSRKEYRRLCSKSDADINELLIVRKAEIEESVRLRNEEYKREQERYARENEDPLVKFMRGVFSIGQVAKQRDLKPVDGRVVEEQRFLTGPDGIR